MSVFKHAPWDSDVLQVPTTTILRRERQRPLQGVEATAGEPSFLPNPPSGSPSLLREEGTTPLSRHRNGATLWTSSGRILPSQPGRKARRGGVPFPRRSFDPRQAATTPPPHPTLELPLPAPEEGIDGEGTGADMSRFLEAGVGERRLSFSSPSTCYEAG